MTTIVTIFSALIRKILLAITYRRYQSSLQRGRACSTTMAARSGSYDTWSNQALSDKDLRDIINELHPLVHKYKLIGIQLGEIEYSDIQRIEAQRSQQSECMLEVISLRLKKTPALTWGGIISALKSPSVGESQIAEGIRKKYGRLTSESEKLSERPQYKSFTSETLLKRTQQKVS